MLLLAVVLGVTTSCCPAGPINPEDEVTDEEEYKDSELGEVEEHKSIILHLLSQLKLGMDLTKVGINPCNLINLTYT